MFSALRSRLTFFYLTAFSIVLILFSCGVYFFVEHILRERLDLNLRVTLQTVSAHLMLPRERAASETAVPANSESRLRDLVEEPRFPGHTVAVVDPNGKLIFSRPAGSTPGIRLPKFPIDASAIPKFYELRESSADADDSCRGIYQLAPRAINGATPILFVITSTESLSDQLDALENVLLIAVLIALAVIGGGGWLLAGQSLAPVAAMAAATERITASNLDERLPVLGNDELGRLASRFNDLLNRLSSSFSQQKQFMADASHELRTPLSVAQSATQVTLQKQRRPEHEYREALGIIQQQIRRLSHIVEDLFSLARADMNQITLDVRELYLNELITEVARGANLLADEKGIHLEWRQPEDAPFRGDERQLRQVFSNLVENAIKFTPPGGTVEILLHRDETRYEIAVRDTGCGIPPELQARVFERFFRADSCRGANAASGAGLGLAIARSIVELHHGEIKLTHSGTGGSTFSVSLPVLG